MFWREYRREKYYYMAVMKKVTNCLCLGVSPEGNIKNRGAVQFKTS